MYQNQVTVETPDIQLMKIIQQEFYQRLKNSSNFKLKS